MPQLRLWKEMLVEAVPLSIGFGIVTLLSKVDVLMLGKLDTFASVGFYSIAYKFADLVAYGVLAVTTPVATLLVAAWPHFTDEFRSRTRAAMVAVALLTTLAAVALWGPAEPVVALLYGERFGEAGNAMRWLLVGAVFSGLTQMVLVVLVAANRQRRYPWIALAALAVNIGLNAALIPRLSYDGAAYATVVTEVVMLAAMWILMVRTVPVRGLMPVGQLAMIAGLGLGVCVVESLVVEFGGVPRAVAAVGAVLVFIALAFALRIADARTLRRLVRS
jgi:O-antigen/teichoic acid export membrane protein